MPPLMMGPWGRELTDRSGATFTAEYKASILAEYDGADRGERGERGAILRREGLYSCHIIEWRKAAEEGAELARTRAGLDLVGKAHALLETLSESAEQPRRSRR